MRTTLCGLTFATLAFSAIGQQVPPPPKELADAAWMVGKWTGTGTSMMQGMEGKVTSSVRVRRVLDSWYEWDMDDNVAGMKSGGRMMFTYDPMAKRWVSVYFNGSGPEAIKSGGHFKGGTLAFESEWSDMMGAKVRFKTVHKMMDKSTMDFELWMDMGKGFEMAMHTAYKRK